MVNILKKIFGTAETTETIVKGAVAGLDALVFTEEERAHMDAQARDWFLKYLDATQPQNLDRRLIAMVIVALWTLLVLVCIAAWPISKVFAAFVFSMLTEVVAIPFALIMTFYFAAHAIRANKK